jgi:hypothetical protein
MRITGTGWASTSTKRRWDALSGTGGRAAERPVEGIREKEMRMKRGAVVFWSVVAMILLGAAWAAAEDVDPTGSWRVARSNSKTVGMCPMGGDGSGVLEIEKAAGGLTLTYGEGMACRPAEVCRLTGSESGGTYTFTTTVPVDDEGGKVTNTAELVFTSAASANGSGSSRYVHPEGFSCTWTFDLTLSR